MSFRKKIIIFVILVSSGLLIFLYSSLLFVLNKNFSYLEDDAVDRRLKRVESVANTYFNSLKSKAYDWGEWDEAYDFTVDQNQVFVESNLNDISLINLDVNAIAFVDNDGNVQGVAAYDFVTEKTDPDFLNLLKGELTDPYFKKYFMSNDYQQGIVLFSGDRPPFLMVSKQVLRSDKSGPALGHVFMGRFLDEAFVNYRFGDIALYSTMLERVDSAKLPNDFLEARNRLILNDSYVISPKNSQNIYGYSLFKDYSNNPAFVFRIETDRLLYQYEINILIYISVLLFAMILIFVLFFLWMINRVFVSRLIKMFNKVEEYKKNPDAEDIDISIPGKDELSALSDEFNNLVKELADSRNFYRNLLVRLPDIVILAKAGRAIYVNDAFEAATGFKKEDLMGKDVFSFVSPEYQDVVNQNMKMRFSGVDVEPYIIKIATSKKDLYARVNAKVINYQGDKVDLIVLTDVSATIESQKNVEEKVDELERLNRIMINRELKMMDLKKKIEESDNANQKK